MMGGEEMEVADVDHPKLQSNVNDLSAGTFHDSTRGAVSDRSHLSLMTILQGIYYIHFTYEKLETQRG